MIFSSFVNDIRVVVVHTLVSMVIKDCWWNLFLGGHGRGRENRMGVGEKEKEGERVKKRRRWKRE